MKLKKKILSLALTLCMLLSLMPGLTVSAGAIDGIDYPEYVITKGADATEAEAGYFYVYKKESSGENFAPFAGDMDHGYAHSTITNVMQYVIPDVGTGHATLIFGETGTTDTDVIGTLDIGEDDIDLGESGTYTLTGRLSGSGDATVSLSGASLIIDGASIQNSSETTINNGGEGEITVSGGTVKATGSGYAIDCFGSSHITVSGGTVESTGSSTFISAIFPGDDGITISGGKIYCKNGPAIFNPKGGDVDISGAVWNEADGTGTLLQSEGDMGCIMTSGRLTMEGGTISSENIGIYSSATTEISGGVIKAVNGAALCVDGATCRISGDASLTSANAAEASADSLNDNTYPGTVWVSDSGNGNAMLYISGGSITNTATGPAVFNIMDDSELFSDVSLSGSPTISGTADIWVNASSYIYAYNDEEEPSVAYSGDDISVCYGGTIKSGETVAVEGVNDSNFSKFSLANEGYKLTRSGSSLLISEGGSEPSPSIDSGDYTPSRTISVTETSSDLFSGSAGQIKAEANMDNAFSNSVEVKVTDTAENSSGFGLGAGNEVYPFDISLYIKGTKTKTEPKDGYAVTISLPVPDKLLEVKDQLSIVHKSDSGTVTTLKSQLKQINGVWYLEFNATEFSPYAMVVSSTGTYDETAGLPYYLDSNGKEVFIGFAANGKYLAPSGTTVLFKANTKDFTDIGSHWAKDYIGFVTERELFSGTDGNRFSPDSGMTRAMFATVIGRLYERSYGEIEASGTHAFSDCDYGDYYGKYSDWAGKNGIISGYGDGRFGPDDLITREQMAAILYRFADFLGAMPSKTDAALTYPDAGNVSDWAQSAVLYCQTTGIITGRGGSFVPRGLATRAEVAVILERFIENVL